jgi:hypothetical protein
VAGTSARSHEQTFALERFQIAFLSWYAKMVSGQLGPG